jgi:hypothetical protein
LINVQPEENGIIDERNARDNDVVTW